MIKSLDSMLTINTYGALFPDRIDDDTTQDGILFLATTTRQGIIFINNEWSIQYIHISSLLELIKEHIVALHSNKTFMAVECFPKLDENGYPEIEIYCKYQYNRKDVYIETIEIESPKLSPIDKKKYKIKGKK